MEHRQQAEQLYKQTRCHSSEETNQLPTVKKYLRLFVCKCQPLQKFQIKEIPDIIMNSAQQPSFVSIKASEAFDKLEYYFSLISTNPWKAEFHTIKKYSGFFQTKIASHLSGVDSLFRKAGYSENVTRNEINWTNRAGRDLLLAIAFECLIASVECLILHEIQVRTKFSVTAIEIAILRTSTPGDTEEACSVLQKKYNLNDSVIKSPVQTVTPLDHVDQLSPRQTSNQISYEQTVPGTESDMRLDGQNSEFREGTLDDHLLASLQLIEEENSPAIKQPSVRPSDEWSFVQEGLRKKYGERYFDRQGGNILTPSSKESKPYRDSGIGSGIPSEHVYGTTSGIPSEQPYGEVDTMKTRSTRPTKEKVPQIASRAQNSWTPNPEQSPLHRSQYSWPQHEPQPTPVHRPQFSSPFPQATTKTEMLKSRNKSVSATCTYPSDHWLPKGNSDDHWLPKGNPDILEHSNDEDISEAIRPSRSITKTDFVADEDQTTAPVYSRISKAVVKERLPSAGHCQPLNFGSHSAPIARRDHEERIPSSSLGDDETWVCDHCTMKNRYLSNTCSVCSKSKDILKSPDVRWGKACPRCTLINAAEAYACAACDNKLPEACDIPLK